MVRLKVAIHQKLLSVRADVIGENISRRNKGASSHLEKCNRRSTGKSSFRCNGRRHHHSRLSDIEKFFAIVPPAWLVTSTARDLPLSGAGRKRSDIGFPLSGFIRRVGCPLSIRRYLAIRFGSLARQEGNGCSTRGRYKNEALDPIPRGLREEHRAEDLLVIQRPGIGQGVRRYFRGEQSLVPLQARSRL